MLKTCTLTALLLLPAAPALATFELLDPAAGVHEKKTPEDVDTGAVTCHDFLLNSAKNPGTYQVQLKWVMDRVREGQDASPSQPVEPPLRDYCVENARHNLQQAADSLATERY